MVSFPVVVLTFFVFYGFCYIRGIMNRQFYRVEGIDKAVAQLNELLDKSKTVNKRHVDVAAKLIYRDSQKRVPVDTGLLKASAYMRPVENGSFYGVMIGYDKEYAIYVHERMDLKHGPERCPYRWGTNYTVYIGPGHEKAEAKFLQNAVKANSKKVKKIIANSGNIKPLV